MNVVTFLRCVVLTLAASLAASCGGGGNGGGGGGGGAASVMLVTVQGVGAPIFTNGQAPQPVCPQGAFLNGRVSITFNGPVDVASLPPDGPAVGGGIQVVDIATNVPAVGVFSIDATNPAIVHFTALPPGDPNQGCAAGFQPNAVYSVFVPDQTSGQAQTITANGNPVGQAITTCFSVRSCGGPGDMPFTDSDPNPPAVISSSPAMSPAAPMTTLAALQISPTSSQVTIDIDQALDAQSITSSAVSLRNLSASPGSAIPQAVTVTFNQFGFVPGLAASRIVLQTNVPLVDGDVYELLFNGIVDLGAQPLVVNPGDLLFTVINNNDDTPSTITEDFTSTANRESTVGEIEWPGDGAVRGSFPIEIIGDGSNGAANFNAAMNINTDMTATTLPGVFNFTSLSLGNASIFNLQINAMSMTDTPPGQSNAPLRFRSQGNVTFVTGVRLVCNGRPGLQGGGAPAASTSLRLGGWGGPGAGAGGVSSPETNNMPSAFGLPGEGGHVSLNDPNLPGDQPNLNSLNPLYGGGGGGALAAAQNSSLGGGGGGGGSASSFGGYVPLNPLFPPTFSFTTSQDGETHTGPSAPAAGFRGPFPPAMVLPLLDCIGGNGGGAGGDRAQNPTNPATQFPGGSGGGGGGAARVTAGQNVTFQTMTEIQCRGGNGGSLLGLFGGTGGGGSGGSIVVQAFGNVSFSIAASFFTTGAFSAGVNNNATLNGEGGRGGDGVIQIQDGTGMFLSTLIANSVIVAGEFFLDPITGMNPVSIGGGNLSGIATSIPIDSGSLGTTYVSAVATSTIGTVAGSSVLVEIRGVSESLTNIGNPTMTAMGPNGETLITGWLPLASIAQLNGYRFFQFRVTTAYPPPPAASLTDTLPEVSNLDVNIMN